MAEKPARPRRRTCDRSQRRTSGARAQPAASGWRRWAARWSTPARQRPITRSPRLVRAATLLRAQRQPVDFHATVASIHFEDERVAASPQRGGPSRIGDERVPPFDGITAVTVAKRADARAIHHEDQRLVFSLPPVGVGHRQRVVDRGWTDAKRPDTTLAG